MTAREDQPFIDMGPIKALAISYNEMVKGFQEGGFSRKEAMQFALEHFRLSMSRGFDQADDGDS